MKIGERIKHNRESLKITQDELGAACGTSKQTIFKYENGIITNIPLDKIEKISKALNVSPAYLMGWEEDKKQSTTGNIDENASTPVFQTKDERAARLMNLYQQLTPENQETILAVMRGMLHKDK